MHASVRESFLSFSTRFEGAIPWLYLDILGLVTTSIGVLVDPISSARLLPLIRRSDGARATVAEVEEEWRTVKAHPTAARLGYKALENVTRLRLTPEGIEQVALAKASVNETILQSRFPTFDSWPADAQLGTLSMAWACGANFDFPKLARALFDGDFSAASRECHIDTRGPDRLDGTADDNRGLIPRNAATRVLFENAGIVIAQDLPPEVLYWPRSLARERIEAKIDGCIVHPRVPLPDRG